jgi:hypothetical protein
MNNIYPTSLWIVLGIKYLKRRRKKVTSGEKILFFLLFDILPIHGNGGEYTQSFTAAHGFWFKLCVVGRPLNMSGT